MSFPPLFPFQAGFTLWSRSPIMQNYVKFSCSSCFHSFFPSLSLYKQLHDIFIELFLFFSGFHLIVLSGNTSAWLGYNLSFSFHFFVVSFHLGVDFLLLVFLFSSGKTFQVLITLLARIIFFPLIVCWFSCI